MINKLVLENLKFRWVRTFLSALVVGVQVMSILTLVGLSRGMLEDSARRARAIGADIFLRADTGGTISLSQAQINEKFIPFVEKQPHVVQAIGMYSVSVQVITYMNGVNFDEFSKFSGGVHFIEGRPPQGPDDLLVDDYYARQNHISAGQTIPLLNHQWHVTGIIQNGVLSHLIAPIKTIQRLTGSLDPPKVTQIAVKLDNSALTDEVVNELNQKLKGNLVALSSEALASYYNVNSIPPLRIFITIITILTASVAALVVFLSMYTAVVERTREIGILKAIGARPITILDLLIREAILLAVVGWIIGVILSFGTRALIVGLVPASFQMAITPDWWPNAAAIAIGGALLGALYPGMPAARQDAIEALAYE
jgi:putative ABC transport system permease protein